MRDTVAHFVPFIAAARTGFSWLQPSPEEPTGFSPTFFIYSQGAVLKAEKSFAY